MAAGFEQTMSAQTPAQTLGSTHHTLTLTHPIPTLAVGTCYCKPQMLAHASTRYSE
jgi:hypothetical protein